MPDIMERIIRRFAGTFILASLALAHYHNPNWLWFTAFVGFNLLQSSFTNFCPLELILRKLGVDRDSMDGHIAGQGWIAASVDFKVALATCWSWWAWRLSHTSAGHPK